MTQAEFEDALEKNHRRIAEITKAIPTATDAEIEPLLTEFLCCKYFLEPEELTTDKLLALGEYSTAKMAGYANQGIKFVEKSAGCTTASSGTIKKILLAMAIGKIMGIQLEPNAVARVDTISQLAALIIAGRKR